MDFIDHVRVLANRIANTRDIIQSEEATKNAMLMPFIQIPGCNVFDPLEVTRLRLCAAAHVKRQAP